MARWIVAVMLAAVTFGVYAIALNRRAVNGQEQVLASASEALRAHRGRDADGRFMPLFVHVGGDTWLPGAQVFAAATIDRSGSSSPPPIRWIVVFTGALDVMMMFALAMRICASAPLGCVAALLLLFTPAHAQFSRLAIQDGVWPLPLLMAWLLGLVIFVDRSARSRRSALAVGVMALAFIAYIEPSGPLTALVFLVLTIAVLRAAGDWRAQDLKPACIAFVMTIVPLALWFVTHRTAYPDTLGRWAVHLAHLRNPLEGVRAATSAMTVATVSGVYWDFLSPTNLFIDGNAAGWCGVFTIPVAVLLLAGVWTIARDYTNADERRPIDILLVAGFLCAPLVAATFKEPRVTQRALTIVPFGVLLAARGLEKILSSRTPARRTLAALLLLAVPFQFYFWYSDFIRLH